MNYWRGLYLCTNFECYIKYEAIIKKVEINSDVTVEVSWEGDCNHKNEIKASRIIGNERQELAKEFLIKGTSNVKSENIIYNIGIDKKKGI
jgi:hypothetical protein